jgi:hypothetical protein
MAWLNNPPSLAFLVKREWVPGAPPSSMRSKLVCADAVFVYRISPVNSFQRATVA